MKGIVLVTLVCTSWCPVLSLSDLCLPEQTVKTADICLLKETHGQNITESLSCVETTQDYLDWDCLTGFSDLKAVVCLETANITCNGTRPMPPIEVLCSCLNEPASLNDSHGSDGADLITHGSTTQEASVEGLNVNISWKKEEIIIPRARSGEETVGTIGNPGKNDENLESHNQTKIIPKTDQTLSYLFLFWTLGLTVILLTFTACFSIWRCRQPENWADGFAVNAQPGPVGQLPNGTSHPLLENANQ